MHWLPHCYVSRSTKVGLKPHVLSGIRRSQALCVDVGVGGVLLDELAAWLHVVAHKH